MVEERPNKTLNLTLRGCTLRASWLHVRLSRLEQELKELKATLPEHCSGMKGYISVHHASTTYWQKIEDIEEEIEKLKLELDDIETI